MKWPAGREKLKKNMHGKKIISGGLSLESAEKVMIMLHGRGAPAENILGLARYLDLEGFALLAPQAANSTWYPQSFLAPRTANEPWLGSALQLLKGLEAELLEKGFGPESLYFLGFSQGACLSLEYAARNAKRYGGVIAFTGGLIGERLNPGEYRGDFDRTPVFIGSSDPDMHVPVARVHETGKILQSLNAGVDVQIYPDMGHTVSEEEILAVNESIFRSPGGSPDA
jgi:phospholipase/carboxylesterase